MKNVVKSIGFCLMFLLFSVGFQYKSRGTAFPVNIYSIDSLLLVADEMKGILIYSVPATDTPQLLQTIQLKGVRGMAMKDSTVFVGTWDGVLAYQRGNSGTYDSVCAVYRWNCCMNSAYGDVYYSRSPMSCGCSEPVMYDGAGTEAEGSGGVGGSYAVFAIIDTFLYVVDGSYLVTFSIARPDSMYRLSYIDVSWPIETLYPMETCLYIGGTNGMYIVDRTDGANPKLSGTVAHFRACDPVVVKDSTAWVTLRSGSRCGSSNDELWTVSVKDPYKPELLYTTAASTPYGLAVRDSLLYVANGHNGFSLYRVDGENKPVLLKQWDDYTTKDFIWSEDRLFVMTFNEVYIVNVTDPMEPRLVYTLP